MGTVIYEANPPKVAADTDAAIAESLRRLLAIAPKCDSIHITENVLGFERVSPITMGRKLRDEMPRMPITVSLRVRDKTEREIAAFVSECVNAELNGILVLMGDPPRDGRPDTGQIPSAVTNRLKEQGVDSRMDLYLSVPNEPSASQIQRKIRARPSGFFTQVVQNIQQVKDLALQLDGFDVIPVVLHPSPKNQKSAEFLNLDLGTYADRFEEFVKEVHRITGNVLITSPNDFAAADEFLARLKA